MFILVRNKCSFNGVGHRRPPPPPPLRPPPPPRAAPPPPALRLDEPRLLALRASLPPPLAPPNALLDAAEGLAAGLGRDGEALAAGPDRLAFGEAPGEGARALALAWGPGDLSADWPPMLACVEGERAPGLPFDQSKFELIVEDVPR